MAGKSCDSVTSYGNNSSCSNLDNDVEDFGVSGSSIYPLSQFNRSLGVFGCVSLK